jgi:lysophospholipase L1-like esterase
VNHWRTAAVAMTAVAVLLAGVLAILWRRHQRLRALSHDWAGVSVYSESNKSGLQANAGERVVFIGDSIVEQWPLAEANERYVNRGISSQNTSQVLARFRTDALDLHPRAIVVLAGSNDLAAGNTLPDEVTKGNYQSIAELARLHGVKLVFVSVPPTRPDSEGRLWRPNDRIVALNGWLRDFAAQQGIEYADCYSVLAASDGQLRREFSDDGLHPNASGFGAMTPVVQAALDRALRRAAVR